MFPYYCCAEQVFRLTLNLEDWTLKARPRIVRLFVCGLYVWSKQAVATSLSKASKCFMLMYFLLPLLGGGYVPQLCAYQHQGWVAVRLTAHHPRPASDLPVQPLYHIFGANLDPVLKWGIIGWIRCSSFHAFGIRKNRVIINSCVSCGYNVVVLIWIRCQFISFRLSSIKIYYGLFATWIPVTKNH